MPDTKTKTVQIKLNNIDSRKLDVLLAARGIKLKDVLTEYVLRLIEETDDAYQAMKEEEEAVKKQNISYQQDRFYSQLNNITAPAEYPTLTNQITEDEEDYGVQLVTNIEGPIQFN